MNAALPPRAPAVAGAFYPGSSREISLVMQRWGLGPGGGRPARMVMCPHAGWVYSGAIAAQTLAQIRVPERVLLLGPNHTGVGPTASLWSGGPWELPDGEVPIDEPLRQAIARRSPVTLDRSAHAREHSLEVLVPLLRARRPDVRIVPLVLGPLAATDCLALGRDLAAAIAEIDPSTLIVASSDMSHYIPADAAARLDELALTQLLALDPENLYRTVRARHITMCGVVPVTTGLAAARLLGARRAELVRYGNSGETSGDDERVVGYAGVIVE